ncbi:hypothetical protein Sjap_002131 [Stephania japonica]|uniref:Uncharacterized protein n=1 Tax=Stephania japonica TaxID=461633 RepID=A0AAP0KLG6_9MAGN
MKEEERSRDRGRELVGSRRTRYNSGGNFDLLGIYSRMDWIIGVRYSLFGTIVARDQAC